jgi:hypothetical protein
MPSTFRDLQKNKKSRSVSSSNGSEGSAANEEENDKAAHDAARATRMCPELVGRATAFRDQPGAMFATLDLIGGGRERMPSETLGLCDRMPMPPHWHSMNDGFSSICPKLEPLLCAARQMKRDDVGAIGA